MVPPDELLGSSGENVLATLRLPTTSEGKRSSCTDWLSGSGLGTGAPSRSVLL